MLTNLTNEQTHVKLKRSLITAVCACASYIGHAFREKREAAARGLLEVSLRVGG